MAAIAPPGTSPRRLGWLCALVVAAMTSASSPAAHAGPRIVEDDDEGRQAAIAAEVAPAPDAVQPPAAEVDEASDDRDGVDLGVLAGLLYDSEDYIADEALLGGASLFVRWRVLDAFALTMDLGSYHRRSEPNALDETWLGFDYGFNWYVYDAPVWDLFFSWGGAFGWGFVTQARATDDIDDKTTTWFELGAYLGLGADVRLFDDWLLTAELRMPIMALSEVEQTADSRATYVRNRGEGRVLIHSAVGVGYRF